MADISKEAEINKRFLDLANSELVDTKKEFEATVVTLKATQQERVALKFSNDALKTRIGQLKSQIDDLRGELSAKSEHLATKVDLEGRLVELEQQLCQAHVDLDNKSKQMISIDEALNKLLADKKNIEEELAFVQSTNADLQNQLVEKGHQLDAEQHAKNDLQNKLVDVGSKFETLEFKNNCAASLKRSLRKAKVEVEELQKRLAARQVDVLSSTETTAIVTDDSDALRQQLKERSTSVAKQQQEIEKRNRLLTMFQTMITNTKDTIAQAESSRKELEQAKKASDKRARILEHENEILARLMQDVQQDLDKQSTANMDLEQELANSEQERTAERDEASRKAHAISADHRDRNKGYKKTVRAKDSKIKNLEDKLNTANTAASTTEEQSMALITRLRDDMARKTLDLDDERAKVAASWDWAQEKVEENAKLQKDNQDLTNRMSSLDEEQQALRQTNKALVQEKDEQQKAKQDLEKRLSVLEGGQVMLRRFNQVLKQQVDDLESQNVNLQTCKQEHEDEMWVLRTDCDSLVAHSASLEYHAATQDVHIANLLGLNMHQAGALEYHQTEDAHLRSVIADLFEQIKNLTEAQQQQHAQQTVPVETVAQELKIRDTQTREPDIWEQVAEDFAPESEATVSKTDYYPHLVGTLDKPRGRRRSC